MGGRRGSARAFVRACACACVCVLSDGEAHDPAASLHCHSVHSSHPVSGTSRGRMRRVRAHRSIATTAASEFTADTSAEPYSMCATGELRNAALSARNKGPYRTLVRSRGPPRRRVEEATRLRTTTEVGSAAEVEAIGVDYTRRNEGRFGRGLSCTTPPMWKVSHVKADVAVFFATRSTRLGVQFRIRRLLLPAFKGRISAYSAYSRLLRVGYLPIPNFVEIPL